VRATGRASTLAGVLVCAAGVALLLMAKNGLGTGAGWILLVLFIGALAGARLSAGRTQCALTNVTVGVGESVTSDGPDADKT